MEYFEPGEVLIQRSPKLNSDPIERDGNTIYLNGRILAKPGRSCMSRKHGIITFDEGRTPGIHYQNFADSGTRINGDLDQDQEKKKRCLGDKLGFGITGDNFSSFEDFGDRYILTLGWTNVDPSGRP